MLRELAPPEPPTPRWKAGDLLRFEGEDWRVDLVYTGGKVFSYDLMELHTGRAVSRAEDGIRNAVRLKLVEDRPS